jgi:hypothetical protein
MFGISHARKPTLTSSPLIIEFRVQPSRIRAFGLSISIPQFVTAAAPPLTSI